MLALHATVGRRVQAFEIPFLGITGSNGKTTTKELVRDVLAKKFKVHATVGNFNNHIGVPLTLLAMPKETTLAIIEMGANHQGEIALLSSIADPDYGLITNIGKAHLEAFGGIEGVPKEPTNSTVRLSSNSAAGLNVAQTGVTFSPPPVFRRLPWLRR